MAESSDYRASASTAGCIEIDAFLAKARAAKAFSTTWSARARAWQASSDIACGIQAEMFQEAAEIGGLGI